MAVPKLNDLVRWHDRWKNHPNLAEILRITLKGNPSAKRHFQFAHERLTEAKRIMGKECSAGFDLDIPDESIAGLSFPVLDLRGIDWHGKDLSDIYFIFTLLDGANMGSANLDNCRFWGIIMRCARVDRATFRGAIFDGYEQGTIAYSSFSGVNLKSTYFKNIAIEGSDFEFSIVGKYNELEFATLGNPAISVTTFQDITFQPNDSWLSISRNLWLTKRYLRDRWLFTIFTGVRIEDTDTTLSADLRRYIEDQRFVLRVKQTSKIAYNVWNLTTACGWSTVRLMFWAILVIIGFACLYANFGLVTPPDLVTHAIVDPVIPSIGPAVDTLRQVAPVEMINVSPAFQWFYVSSDIFTNLGIRVTTKPASNWGVVVMFIETVLGWMTLGLALTVFANKYARRS